MEGVLGDRLRFKEAGGVLSMAGRGRAARVAARADRRTARQVVTTVVGPVRVRPLSGVEMGRQLYLGKGT
ncbi:hypothetical protein ACSSS7_006760 [Eimeria intestinalis]